MLSPAAQPPGPPAAGEPTPNPTGLYWPVVCLLPPMAYGYTETLAMGCIVLRKRSQELSPCRTSCAANYASAEGSTQGSPQPRSYKALLISAATNCLQLSLQLPYRTAAQARARDT